MNLHRLREDNSVVGGVEVRKLLVADRYPGEFKLTVRLIIQSIQMVNRDGARTYPCRTSVGTGKNSDVPPPPIIHSGPLILILL